MPSVGTAGRIWHRPGGRGYGSEWLGEGRQGLGLVFLLLSHTASGESRLTPTV